jgi:hypothetical protein
VTEPTTLPLLVLMIALVVTRPVEERWWKSGRISDRVAAWLIVGRLPVLATGFGLIIGLPLLQVAVLVAIGLVAAFVLQPVAAGRLIAARARPPRS